MTIPQSEPKQKRNRAETEQRLIDVALEMIQKNGVLGGLNLREVAAAAGVNRGNIYHYFGSRQELLRGAINRQFQRVLRSLSVARQRKPFAQRRLEAFRQKESSNDSQLRALLVLDGDSSVDPMPRFESQLSELRQAVIDGDVHPDHDLEALQVALSAALRGYRIFRAPYARRMGIKVTELDHRITRAIGFWLEALPEAPKAPASQQPESTNLRGFSKDAGQKLE
jgi:AcrR family transcriptional regulator